MALTPMKTSEDGIVFLDRHEGDVLKAYRDPVGIWTIGKGLTKASGVIVPKAGMVISKAESMRLTKLALNRNYEPAVRAAMPTSNQHEFDGAVSFNWNTGAIKRASWVKRWRLDDWAGVEVKLKLWNKAGGKVWAGLVRRRDEEYRLMRHGIYRQIAGSRKVTGLGRIVLPMDPEEIATLRANFKQLGYAPGVTLDGISIDQVRAFQRDHDLTVDGIIGKATLSTLQRMIDARKKAVVGAGGTAAGTGAGAALPEVAVLPVDPTLIGLGVGVVVLGWLAWSYRDAIAVKVQGRMPKLATWLRSR